MRQTLDTVAAYIFALLVSSCAEMEEPPGNSPAGCSPILLTADSAVTRTRAGIPEGMYDNFKVYAISLKSGTPTVEMDNYEVTYQATGWTYETASQPLCYWKRDADAYRFTAGSPVSDVTSLDSHSLTLQMTNNLTGSALYSHPLVIEAADPEFGTAVNISFGYAHCRVRVAFIKDDTENVAVTGIRLTPDAPITSKANMTFSYDWEANPAAVTSLVSTTETSSAAFTYADVNIPAHTGEPVPSATMHYCIPNAANPQGWQITLTCQGEAKAASFENNTPWESGKSYTYVFSLDAKTPKLVQVITGDEDFFDCEDILPGDSFTDNDMTE